jgi:hypothetical protein
MHSIWQNPKSGQLYAVPRHAEIKRHRLHEAANDTLAPQRAAASQEKASEAPLPVSHSVLQSVGSRFPR